MKPCYLRGVGRGDFGANGGCSWGAGIGVEIDGLNLFKLVGVLMEAGSGVIGDLDSVDHS
jgi:hypothetical protein